MASEPAAVLDDYGDKVRVGRTQEGRLVLGVTQGLVAVNRYFTGDRLDALREAIDRAVMPGQPGEAPATEARAALCQVPGDCSNGPGPHPFTPVKDDPLPRPCCRQPSEIAIVPAVLAGDDCGCSLGPERCAAAEDGET